MNPYLTDSARAHIRMISNGGYDGHNHDVNISLDIFDSIHKLPHNAKHRAEYKACDCPVNLSVDERRICHENNIKIKEG